jgi:high-affinity Fe2+/Pb2+ permease
MTNPTKNAAKRATRSAWLVLAAAFGVVLLPAAAQACPVCFSGNGEANRAAFMITTAFLTALPLVMIGGVVWWFRRRFVQMERERTELAAARGDLRSVSLRSVA